MAAQGQSRRVAAKQDTVKRFIRAYSEGIFEFKTNRDKAIKMDSQWLEQKDLAVLDESHQFTARIFPCRRASIASASPTPSISCVKPARLKAH